jgi:hypothetical protein
MPSLPSPGQSIPWWFVLVCVIFGLQQVVVDQAKKITQLQSTVAKQKNEIMKLKSYRYTDSLLTCDSNVSFFTGLPNKSVFDRLHSLIVPFVKRRWTGVTRICKFVRNLKKPASRFGPQRKLTSRGEFLLMLMKLRLGLLNKDLANRFSISESLSSRIFLTWLRASGKVLGSMVNVLDQDTLIATKPVRYRNLPDLHSIIDCTEVFIETPKDLHLQASTWSNYKHHNTLKLLVACSPNSTIMYVSPAYPGRTTDKDLTVDCGYLDNVPPNMMLMADKGFNIREECEAMTISLYVPPGKRGQLKMSSACVSKTKNIANRRILIEQVIRRLKTFRILANELPLTLVSHIDDICVVCAALSNLKKPIYKY